MKVVLDTNIVVSRFLSPQGSPARILTLWEEGVFELLVSEGILNEYERALSYDNVRKRHGFTIEEIKQWMHNARKYGHSVASEEVSIYVSKDPDDDKFIECAVAGGADYIVSGDTHLLSLGEYKGIQILSPAAFLLVLNL